MSSGKLSVALDLQERGIAKAVVTTCLELARDPSFGYKVGERASRILGNDSGTGTVASAPRGASIRGWWRQEGRRIYPDGTILITADGREQRVEEI